MVRHLSILVKRSADSEALLTCLKYFFITRGRSGSAGRPINLD